MTTPVDPAARARAAYREVLCDLIVRATDELRLMDPESDHFAHDGPSNALGGVWDRVVSARVRLACALVD